MNIRIKKLFEGAVIPKYQTKGSAGFDLHSNEDITILAGQTLLVKTGLAVEIPEGFEMQIRPRSGLALKHGITVWNSPGCVDSDYREEVGIILTNAGKNFTIKRGDRIAQGTVNKVESVVFEEVYEIDTSKTERKGGFGSTGIN